ncbi:MAG: hypothetical protein V2A71_03145, partial [Candidatus Eisenbacteria bacterium]
MERYGREGFDALSSSLTRYAGAASERGVRLTTVFVDDPASLSPLRIKPLTRITATSVKVLVDKVIRSLSAVGGRVPESRQDPSGTHPAASGTRRSSRATQEPDVSVLIVGGGEVIPYFMLPNPTLDSDGHVLSDNPYGSPPGVTSANACLLPERPVGRLPDGDGSDVGLLVGQIDAAGAARPGSLGYTASVWKAASQQVWSEAGFTGALKVSPPLSHSDVRASWFEGKGVFYFNVHGSDTEPYWFGQKDESLPVALSPRNVIEWSAEDNMVVTEACYGAVETGKCPRTSMALAFLSKGTLCFLGSTCVAYGALSPPVGEADLIALYFFRN